MNLTKLRDQLEQATARIDAMVCLAGMLCDGNALSDPLTELLEERDDALKRCFPDMPPWLLEVVESDDPLEEAFGEWATEAGKLGFALKFATPVMKPVGKDCSTYSWGRYSTTWVYGDTLHQAVKLGLTWVAERRRSEQAKG